MNHATSTTGEAVPSAANAGRGVRSPDESADPRLVLADCVGQLFRQAPIGIGGTLLVVALVAYELYPARMRELVMLWLWVFIMLLIAAARYTLVVGYHRDEKRDQNPERWLRWFAIGALAEGVNWGFAAGAFFLAPDVSDVQRVFLAFVLATMTAGGLPLFSAVWWVFGLYAFGVVVPLEAVLFTYDPYGKRLFADLALMIPFLLAINLAVAYRLNEVFVSGYRLRQAYGRLTEDYTALNQRLEQQLVELGEARRQVEASGRKLALFAERSPIAVFEFDPEGRILNMNPAAETLFGYSSSEVVGRPGTDTLFPAAVQGDVINRWRDLIRSREPLFGMRVNCVRRDGAEIVCEWSLTPLVNPEKRVISVIVQGRDVTQQLEAERLKQEFTSTLSHELRTPLTSIIGSLQLINSGVLGEIDKDVLELTSIAERNGQRLLDLINDILDVEKIESGKLTLVPEVIPLGELVDESLTLNRAFADRFKVRLVTAGAQPAVSVNADRKRLLQVMTNLLSNAAKFSPEGSAVEVTMECVASNVRVGVHDNGPGIPESFRGRIFGRFAQADMSYTRQKGGTGLGLAICKRLIEMTGGKIGFSNREGGGTTFWFELPLQS